MDTKCRDKQGQGEKKKGTKRRKNRIHLPIDTWGKRRKEVIFRILESRKNGGGHFLSSAEEPIINMHERDTLHSGHFFFLHSLVLSQVVVSFFHPGREGEQVRYRK